MLQEFTKNLGNNAVPEVKQIFVHILKKVNS